MLDLEDQIRRHADWVASRMAPLDAPHAPVDPAGPTDRSSARGGRRLWLAVAAAAAVILVAGTVVARTSRGGGPGTR